MKKLPFAFATAFALGGAALPAEARPRREYSSEKSLGLGIQVGAPTGLAGKYFLGESSAALAFGVGGYYETYDHDGLEAHLDVLFHPVLLTETNDFRLPLYLGVGGRILDHDDYWHNNHWHDDATHLGIRVPVGIAFDLTRVPLDIFAELVPVWDIVDEDEGDFVDDHHHDHFDLTGAIGLRYYF